MFTLPYCHPHNCEKHAQEQPPSYRTGRILHKSVCGYTLCYYILCCCHDIHMQGVILVAGLQQRASHAFQLILPYRPRGIKYMEENAPKNVTSQKRFQNITILMTRSLAKEKTDRIYNGCRRQINI